MASWCKIVLNKSWSLNHSATLITVKEHSLKIEFDITQCAARYNAKDSWILDIINCCMQHIYCTYMAYG